MSKSRGNVVNPDDVIQQFGADSMRLYEMFIGPLEKAAPWSTEGIQGIYRFLQRSWRLLVDEAQDGSESLRPLEDGPGTDAQQKLLAQTVQGVTEDLEAMRFNTAISKLMVFARDVLAQRGWDSYSIVISSTPRMPSAPPDEAANVCAASACAAFTSSRYL